MLKNKNNAAFQTQWWMMGAYHCGFITDDDAHNIVIRKIERFIEQCPLKIKRLKIGGFV